MTAPTAPTPTPVAEMEPALTVEQQRLAAREAYATESVAAATEAGIDLSEYGKLAEFLKNRLPTYRTDYATKAAAESLATARRKYGVGTDRKANTEEAGEKYRAARDVYLYQVIDDEGLTDPAAIDELTLDLLLGLSDAPEGADEAAKTAATESISESEEATLQKEIALQERVQAGFAEIDTTTGAVTEKKGGFFARTSRVWADLSEKGKLGALAKIGLTVAAGVAGTLITAATLGTALGVVGAGGVSIAVARGSRSAVMTKIRHGEDVLTRSDDRANQRLLDARIANGRAERPVITAEVPEDGGEPKKRAVKRAARAQKRQEKHDSKLVADTITNNNEAMSSQREENGKRAVFAGALALVGFEVGQHLEFVKDVFGEVGHYTGTGVNWVGHEVGLGLGHSHIPGLDHLGHDVHSADAELTAKNSPQAPSASPSSSEVAAAAQAHDSHIPASGTGNYGSEGTAADPGNHLTGSHQVDNGVSPTPPQETSGTAAGGGTGTNGETIAEQAEALQGHHGHVYVEQAYRAAFRQDGVNVDDPGGEHLIVSTYQHDASLAEQAGVLKVHHTPGGVTYYKVLDGKKWTTDNHKVMQTLAKYGSHTSAKSVVAHAKHAASGSSHHVAHKAPEFKVNGTAPKEHLTITQGATKISVPHPTHEELAQVKTYNSSPDDLQKFYAAVDPTLQSAGKEALQHLARDERAWQQLNATHDFRIDNADAGKPEIKDLSSGRWTTLDQQSLERYQRELLEQAKS